MIRLKNWWVSTRRLYVLQKRTGAEELVRFKEEFFLRSSKNCWKLGRFCHCTKWKWFVDNDQLIMADGDIRGFLAKQGGQENSVAGTETDEAADAACVMQGAA